VQKLWALHGLWHVVLYGVSRPHPRTGVWLWCWGQRLCSLRPLRKMFRWNPLRRASVSLGAVISLSFCHPCDLCWVYACYTARQLHQHAKPSMISYGKSAWCVWGVVPARVTALDVSATNSIVHGANHAAVAWVNQDVPSANCASHVLARYHGQFLGDSLLLFTLVCS
jgi:hypothetical protein